MSKGRMIVMMGHPAGGKSSQARKIYSTVSNTVIVNRDSIREARGKYWVPEQEDYISDIEQFEVEAALKRNLIPIIDATNLNPKVKEKWIEIANKYNAEIEWVECKCSLKEALERDEKRKAEGDRAVGKKVILDFFYKYYPLEYKEYFIDERIESNIYNPHSGKPKAVIVDCDGTLCLHDGRHPFEYNKILSDKSNTPLEDLLDTLEIECEVIFVSGREATDECKKLTREWLDNHCWPGNKLFMRNKHDYRPDEIVKKEIYKKEIEPNYEVVAVFDDRNKVVEMWRSLGLLCCQVNNGDF